MPREVCAIGGEAANHLTVIWSVDAGNSCVKVGVNDIVTSEVAIFILSILLDTRWVLASSSCRIKVRVIFNALTKDVISVETFNLPDIRPVFSSNTYAYSFGMKQSHNRLHEHKSLHS